MADEEGHRPRRLDIDRELVERATAGAARILGDTPSFRALVRLAVERELEQSVALLREAGLTGRPSGRPKPREIDDRVWDALEAAGRDVAIGKVELIRCCLQRLATRPCEAE